MKKTIPTIKEGVIEKIIKDILVLRGDLQKINHKMPPDMVGFYGELLAWKQLLTVFSKKGYSVSFSSGQSKADIVVWKGGKKINVEVKTSRLKKEQPGMVYGFAINIKKCKLHPEATYDHPKKGKIKGDFCYFDYLLLITLSDDLKNSKFYILPRKLLETNERFLRNRSKRFSSASHRIIFVEEPKNSEEITSLDKHLTKNKTKYQNAWYLMK